jgi:hypothetical protein
MAGLLGLLSDAAELTSKTTKVAPKVAKAGEVMSIPAEIAAQFMKAADPAHIRGAEVMDMLKSGRGYEVTDQMLDMGDPVLNARLNEYLYKNSDIPMDEASRMARAKQMGAKSDQLYHATDANIYDFKNSFLGSETAANATDYADGSFAKNLATLGHWASDKPLAGDIGRSIDMPIMVRGKFSNSKSLDSLNAKINRSGSIDAARGNFDGVKVGDEEFGGKSTVIYDPANVRSRFARFDPRLSHLKNLSAGIGGAGLLGAGMMPKNDGRR